MQAAPDRPATSAGTTLRARIPYIAPDIERVVLSYTDRGLPFAVSEHEMELANGRTPHAAPTLEREGFALFRCPSRVVAERRDELIERNSTPNETMVAVNADYLSELLPLIERLSGARDVIAQYDTITVRFSSRAARRSWMSTAAFAHIDFEKTEIDRLLRDSMEMWEREVPPFSRLVLYQAWRVITDPPQDVPLALCDGQSVAAADIVPMEFHGPEGNRNEFVRSRAGRHNAAHKWFYFPDMTPDEVLIFKGFDSSEPDALNALHTAFHDTSRSDAEPRGSIECRFFALYD